MTRRALVSAFLVCLSSAIVFAQVAANGIMVDKLKAAYIFNFIQFVEWPTRTFVGEMDTVVIGVFPGNSVGQALREIVDGESVGGHPLIVRDLKEAKEARRCHVVIIPSQEETRVEDILRSLRDMPALTIGETEGFAERGGAINLFISGNKLRFAINPLTLKSHELKVSSRLLRLGIIVGPVVEESK